MGKTTPRSSAILNRRRRNARTNSGKTISTDSSKVTAWPNSLSKRDSYDLDNEHVCHAFASWAPGMEEPPTKYVYHSKEGEGYVSTIIGAHLRDECIHP